MTSGEGGAAADAGDQRPAEVSLRPCYCGEKAYLAGPPTTGAPRWFVFCGRAICFLRTDHYSSPERAAAEWNGRPEPETYQPAMEALHWLVTAKDLKDAGDTGPEYQWRKERGWALAREVLARAGQSLGGNADGAGDS